MSQKAKYAWGKLKTEFFKSEFKEVKAFFEHKYSTYNSYIRRRAVGWNEGKKVWEKNMAAAIIEETKAYRVEQASRYLNLLVKEVGRRISNKGICEKLSAKEIKVLWEIIRCENQLPIRIQENLNKLNENDMQAVRESLDNKLKSEIF